MNVQDGSVAYLGPGSPEELAFTSTQSEERWALVKFGSYGVSRSETSVGTSSIEGHLSSVPCWTEHDQGDASYTSIGSGEDTWEDWDDCTPIAASMVIGYHEEVEGWQDDKQEAIIDRLHIKMGTNATGATKPFVLNLEGAVSGASDLVVDPMSQGIEDYTEGKFSCGRQRTCSTCFPVERVRQ